jgi:hypothetical protein
MTEAITNNDLFRPLPTKLRSKAELIDCAARAIIQAEADDREAKTQKLRQARLEMEARRAEPAPAKNRAQRKRRRLLSAVQPEHRMCG